MFNNLVQYQYEGNARLVYSILRAQNEFSKLAHIRIVVPPPAPPPIALQLPSPEQVPATGSVEEVVPLPEEVHAESTAEVGAPLATVGDAVETGAAQSTESVVRDAVDVVGVTPPEQVVVTEEGVTVPAISSEKQEHNEVQNEEPERTGNHSPSADPLSQSNAPTAELQGSEATATQVVHNVQPQNIPVFVPTNEWLDSWKRFLPLENILRVITTLSPQIQSLCTGNTSDEGHILDFLERFTLVGLLPVPHPILIRRYQPNDAVQTWLLSYLWGNIYLQHINPPVFLGTDVKLFVINTN